MQLLNLEEIEFCLSADLKLLNLFTGLSSHSGTHACLYCEGVMDLKAGAPRSFSSLITRHADFVTAGAIIKDARSSLTVSVPASSPCPTPECPSCP